MRDSSGNRRLIFKNTEETRRSLPGVWQRARCVVCIGCAGATRGDGHLGYGLRLRKAGTSAA